MRTRMVYHYVLDRLAKGKKESPGHACAATSTRTGSWRPR